MKQFSFGERTIEVDLEATRNYYYNLTVPSADSQCIRNYVEYCKQLLPEESEFFDSLGIIPERCNVDSSGLDEEKNYPTFGSYFVIGRYKNLPKVLWDFEDSDKDDFEYDYPNHSVSIGRFQFEFEHPDLTASDTHKDMPENPICINFSVSSVPWLLKEKCTDKFQYPPKPWQLLNKLNWNLNNKKYQKEYKKDLEDKLISMFENHGIEYDKMSLKEIDTYMREWFFHFVPDSAKAEAEPNCFGTSEWAGYLWHAFSYEYTPCKQQDEARQSYESIERDKCVLLLNYDKIGFVIENAACLSSDVFDQFMDIFITDTNFEWTYVHTHEEYCGPFFATKQA